MVALFTDEFLKSQVAMRGGTLTQSPSCATIERYSEDIDLVVIGDHRSVPGCMSAAGHESPPAVLVSGL